MPATSLSPKMAIFTDTKALYRIFLIVPSLADD